MIRRDIVELFVSLAILPGLAPLAQAQRFPVEDTQTVRRTLEFATGAAKRVLDIRNVNGAIDVTGYDGSTMSFASNPKSDCSFHSLNGAVEVHFRPELSAELRFKSLNGGVFTDFPAAVIPASSSREPRVKVGNGGPEMQFETLNGSIRILQAK